MPARRRLLGGHLGASVSALLDGQLDEAETERAWAHVHQCPACWDLVEHEGWVKRHLAQMAGAARVDRPSDRLLGSLLDLDPAAVAWAETHEIERRGRGRRRAGIALVGAGSVSAAVLGLSALSGAPMGIGGGAGRATPASSIGGATSSSTTTVVPPAASVHGRLRGWTLDSGAGGVAHAHSVLHRR